MPIPPLDDSDHILGPADAPLEAGGPGGGSAPVLIMYGDFQCPYCTAAQSIVARVRKRLDGRLRFAFRHLPLNEVHPDALRAAEASEAAAAQGKFWEMHDALYANGGRFSLDDLAAVAGRLGLDVERFRAELIDGTHTARVERDAEGARAAGIAATPAFIVNGRHHTDAFDAGSLVDALRA
jgi:protein-disulfide isomerase